MKIKDWEHSKVTEALRKQISEYVEGILSEGIPRIPFHGYQQFIKNGSRKEFEDAYFNVRKQLTALGLYLLWDSNEKAVFYFNELIWSIGNEFSWCLAAHLRYEEEDFQEDPEKNIDLFAAETAATLSELSVLHANIIDPHLRSYLIRKVKERVLTPFLEQSWGWETSLSNWCAVCSGSIGMAALMIETGERKERILKKVDAALVNYLRCFGEDGETAEGIGYWAYGFGYYIYYIAMRKELDPDYYLSDMVIHKIKIIAQFPQSVQIDEGSFLPFSDVTEGTVIPTGLISYLWKEYGAIPPLCNNITSFDFDHCYRFAHISRNLWWTASEIFAKKLPPAVQYFRDNQWLVQRNNRCFFAAKGGSNAEEHNHNDVGSFIFAACDELLLTDLGAGPYTADYFGKKRYDYPHTRSYWHNVPLIDGKEQVPTSNYCNVEEVSVDEKVARIRMELSSLYNISELKKYHRTVISDMSNNTILLEEELTVEGDILFEEGFISTVKPVVIHNGLIQWEGRKGKIYLSFDNLAFEYNVEEKQLLNHLSIQKLVYRLGLRCRLQTGNNSMVLKFGYEVYEKNDDKQ